MAHPHRVFRSIALAITIAWSAQRPALANPEVYAPPAPAELQAELQAWIEQQGPQQIHLLEVMAPEWTFDQTPDAETLFNALMKTFYLADKDVRALVDACRNWSFSPALLQVQLPDARRDQNEPLLTHNARYFLGRHLTLLNAYNEALQVFQQIDPQYLVDPGGYFFHRAVCEHHLLEKSEGLESLTLLLEHTEGVPLRRRKLGELMQQDLKNVKEKSLGEVARQMKDVERRLSLHQTGDGTQEVEDRIIATLDELIKKLEDQQQQSSSSSGSSSRSPANPARSSDQSGAPGSGVTKKEDAGHVDNWGDLPPKEREAAKNMLDRQFPAHYRQAVEEYLKKLAERPAP